MHPCRVSDFCEPGSIASQNSRDPSARFLGHGPMRIVPSTPTTQPRAFYSLATRCCNDLRCHQPSPRPARGSAAWAIPVKHQERKPEENGHDWPARMEHSALQQWAQLQPLRHEGGDSVKKESWRRRACCGDSFFKAARTRRWRWRMLSRSSGDSEGSTISSSSRSGP